MDKRTFLKTSALLGGGLTSGSLFAANNFNFVSASEGIALGADGEYTLPPLPYAYDALEPYIDKQTMTLHHDKHHNGYVNGLNKAVAKVKEATESGDFSLVKHWQRELAFHGAGHFLHAMFWEVMGPKQGKQSSSLSSYINKSFGSFDKFMAYFSAASKAVEGSGWGILAYQPMGDRLVVLQSEKHQNLTQWAVVPLLVVDVWEHAYYLKYNNMRGDYIKAFWEVVNWENVSHRLDTALGLTR